MGWKRTVPSRQLETRPSGQLASPVMTGATVCRALFSTSLKKLYPAASTGILLGQHFLAHTAAPAILSSVNRQVVNMIPMQQRMSFYNLSVQAAYYTGGYCQTLCC